jgi:hypothetical protein
MDMQKTLAALTIVTVITAGLSAGPLAADTEFEDNIPIDLARALLRGAGTATEVKLYSDIPDDFPAFTLPDGVTLLGSVDQGRSQQVVLVSESDDQQHLAALIDSLEQNGFLSINQPGAALPQTGFVSADPQTLGIPGQFCHDTQGLVYLRQHAEDDRTFINLTAVSNASRGGYSCADMAAQATNRGSPAFFGGPPGSRSLQTSMPRLVLPEEATTQSPRMPAFLSGSSDQAESKTDFSIAWPLLQVHEFFADQLAAQDWVLEGDTTGNRVALGAWTREDNDRLLLGTLRLVSGEDDGYQAIFLVSLLE